MSLCFAIRVISCTSIPRYYEARSRIQREGSMQDAPYFVSPLRVFGHQLLTRDAFGQRMLTRSAHNRRRYAISKEFQIVEFAECDQSLTHNYAEFTRCP